MLDASQRAFALLGKCFCRAYAQFEQMQLMFGSFDARSFGVYGVGCLPKQNSGFVDASFKDAPFRYKLLNALFGGLQIFKCLFRNTLGILFRFVCPRFGAPNGGGGLIY